MDKRKKAELLDDSQVPGDEDYIMWDSSFCRDGVERYFQEGLPRFVDVCLSDKKPRHRQYYELCLSEDGYFYMVEDGRSTWAVNWDEWAEKEFANHKGNLFVWLEY